MQTRFKTRDPQAQGLRNWAMGRTAFVLRRLAWRVSTASVQLTDIDGPRHGVDKHCQVSLVGVDGLPVVASATARDWHGALNHALARAAAGLKRLMRRAQHGRRRERRHVRDERLGPGPLDAGIGGT